MLLFFTVIILPLSLKQHTKTKSKMEVVRFY